MAYRNKTYVIFDGDTDMRSFSLMKGWKENENIDFTFYDAHAINSARDSSDVESIKAQLRIRMANSKQVVVLVGEKTKRLRKYIPWEIELARKKNLPIIVVNLNGKRTYDSDRCPSAIGNDVYTIHVSFQPKIIQYAFNHFAARYLDDKDKYPGNYKYQDSVYKNLGL